MTVTRLTLVIALALTAGLIEFRLAEVIDWAWPWLFAPLWMWGCGVVLFWVALWAFVVLVEERS